MNDFVRTVLRDFRITVDGPGTQPDARSGAGIWTARTATGTAVYLKVSAPGPSAQRELRFYRDIAADAPVRTPQLLDSAESEAGVALLLTAAGHPRPPAAWTPAMWSELGAALAALHGLPLPADAPPGADFPPVDELFWAGRLPALPDPAALRSATNALTPVFTHGDCHTSNLLHGPAGLAFCDWQSCGPGRPTADLAFLSVRATPSGVVVPPVLLDAYLRVRPTDRATLRRALLAEELATYLCLWPPYAADNSPAGVARVVERTRSLAARWFAGDR